MVGRAEVGLESKTGLFHHVFLLRYWYHLWGCSGHRCSHCSRGERKGRLVGLLKFFPYHWAGEGLRRTELYCPPCSFILHRRPSQILVLSVSGPLSWGVEVWSSFQGRQNTLKHIKSTHLVCLSHLSLFFLVKFPILWGGKTVCVSSPANERSGQGLQ